MEPVPRVYMTLPLNKLTHLQLVSLVQKWRYLPVFGQIGMVGVTCPGACAGSNHFGGASLPGNIKAGVLVIVGGAVRPIPFSLTLVVTESGEHTVNGAVKRHGYHLHRSIGRE